MSSRSRAQSEVVGIILLTGVVVVLMTVVGAIVLSNVVEEAGPRVSVESNVTVDRVWLSHTGGDSVAADDVELVVRDPDSTDRIGLSSFDVTAGDRFEAGTDWETSLTLTAGDVRLLVVHTPSNTVVHEETYSVG